MHARSCLQTDYDNSVIMLESDQYAAGGPEKCTERVLLLFKFDLNRQRGGVMPSIMIKNVNNMKYPSNVDGQCRFRRLVFL